MSKLWEMSAETCKMPSGIKYCLVLHQVSTDNRIPGTSDKQFTFQIKKTSESISSPNKRSKLQVIKALSISSLEHARWMGDVSW